MKYLMMPASNQGDWFTKDIALFLMDEKAMQGIIKIWEWIKTTPPKIRPYIEVRYPKVNVEFLDSNMIDDQEEGSIKEIYDWCILDCQTETVINLEDDFYFDRLYGDVERVIGIHACIDEHGVVFKGHNKYGDCEEIWSEVVEIDFFLDALNHRNSLQEQQTT